MAGNAAVARRMQQAADLMRRRGLKVGAFAGWASAGRSSTMTPRALIAHHTAAPIDVDRILRDGRSDLPGPLCNWALHRDGSWWLVASGRANHAGVGVLPSSESYGVECTGPIPTGNTGVDAFPMYDAYVLGVACICEVEGWSARVVYGHKETATPDGRKPDPAFGDSFPKPYLDMDRFRAQIQARISATPTEEDDLTEAEHDALMWLRKNAVLLRDQGVRMTATGDPDTPADRTTNNLANILARLDQLEVTAGATASRVKAIEGDIDHLVEQLITEPTQP